MPMVYNFTYLMFINFVIRVFEFEHSMLNVLPSFASQDINVKLNCKIANECKWFAYSANIYI